MRIRYFYILVLSGLLLIPSPGLGKVGVDYDFSNGVIIAAGKLAKLEQKAILVLQEEIYKRTGIQLKTDTKIPEDKQPFIAVGQIEHLKELDASFNEIFKSDKALKREGFQLLIRERSIFIGANDARGVLYGVGKLLRCLHLKPGKIVAAGYVKLSSSPRYRIRGHQLGYRAKTNAYDAWSEVQFEQYIRELALFGANSIEIMPPRTDDKPNSVHMKISPLEMMIRQAEMIDAYGMDVWIWYPNMGKDYSNPDTLQKELDEREEIFQKLKRIDAVFVPGGDPGDLHPEVLFGWLEKVAQVLNKYHPRAKVWVSPQAFRPTGEWLEAFYNNVNRNYPWLGGVVFGPWVKTPLPEMRKIVAKEIPIRRYPDITHSISCQYPVKEWDLAYAMTLGRECYNPRPVAEKVIHNGLDEFAEGSLSYSEGINDDVNKFIWSGQDWDPETEVIETLREYSRLFIDPDYTEGIAQGILALEGNWQGRLLSNRLVEVTLKQWQDLEKQVPPETKQKYRFQMCLLRAYYDAYIRERLIQETALEYQAREVLRNAAKMGSKKAMKQAETILNQKWEKSVAQDYKIRCEEIADYLYKTIGSQTSVEKHKAAPGRGDFMDYIDAPLNDAVWLLSNFEKIRKTTSEPERLDCLQELLNRDNPGPGGFYDNLGSSIETPRLAEYPSWENDPGGLYSPRVSFGVGLRGEEWVHTVTAKGFDGSPTPLAWMNQITTLYETPLNLVYNNLDPQTSYRVKVAYTGRFRAQIQMTADDRFQIHAMQKMGRVPIHEFEIPKETTRDGRLKLTWTCGKGERGAQLAEIWLFPVKEQP